MDSPYQLREIYLAGYEARMVAHRARSPAMAAHRASAVGHGFASTQKIAAKDDFTAWELFKTLLVLMCSTVIWFWKHAIQLLLVTVAFLFLYWLLIEGSWRTGAWLHRFGVWVRGRYDDFVLENEWAQEWERRWHHHGLALEGFIINLRFNWFWDGVEWYRQILRERHDQILTWLWRYFWVLLLAMTVSNVLVNNADRPKEIMSVGQYPPDLQARVPDWMFMPRKPGSNWHGQQSAAAGLESDAVTIVDDNESVSSNDPVPRSLTVAITSSSTATSSTPETTTDYWAPRTGDAHKQILGDNWSGWCRVCKQTHCCELPY